MTAAGGVGVVGRAHDHGVDLRCRSPRAACGSRGRSVALENFSALVPSRWASTSQRADDVAELADVVGVAGAFAADADAGEAEALVRGRFAAGAPGPEESQMPNPAKDEDCRKRRRSRGRLMRCSFRDRRKGGDAPSLEQRGATKARGRRPRGRDAESRGRIGGEPPRRPRAAQAGAAASAGRRGRRSRRLPGFQARGHLGVVLVGLAERDRAPLPGRRHAVVGIVGIRPHDRGERLTLEPAQPLHGHARDVVRITGPERAPRR